MAHYAVSKHGNHDPGCRYDFKNRAEHLIKDSRGTVIQHGDIYELCLPDRDKIEPTDRLPPSNAGRPLARLAVSTSNLTLAPALSSALRIVRLLREFDDDPEAAARFRARYAGKKITWARFCRDASDADTVAPQLDELARRHPLVFHGTIAAVGPTGEGATYRLRDSHRGELAHVGGRRPLHVVLRSAHPDAFAGARPGDRWLGYGRWRLWIAPRSPITEVQLWVDGPWSVATWQD